MTSKVSFEGVGEVTATFHADETVEMGQVVKLSGDAAVAPCAAGERFCGVAAGDARDGCAGVQIGGCVSVKCADSTVTVGFVSLTADGSGGVKKAASDDSGAEYLVVSDDGAGTITIKL